MDHAQAIEKEKEFARRWMRKHGGELPSMYDGERINGDPIVYHKPPREWQLREACTYRFDKQIPIDEREKTTLVDALILKSMECGMTPLQAWVLGYRMLGCTQEEIAERMKMKQQSVDQSEQKALYKLKNSANRSNK